MVVVVVGGKLQILSFHGMSFMACHWSLWRNTFLAVAAFPSMLRRATGARRARACAHADHLCLVVRGHRRRACARARLGRAARCNHDLHRLGKR